MWQCICGSFAHIALLNSQKDKRRMVQTPATDSLYEIVFYDDPDTPAPYVSDLIATVFALPRPDAESRGGRSGRIRNPSPTHCWKS